MVSSALFAASGSVLSTAKISLLAGIATHITIRPYEIDSYAWPIVFSYLSALTVLFGCYLQIGDFTVAESLLRTFVASTTFNLGIFGSILIYRAFFHRLHRFPGPFAAKLTRFYAMRNAAKNLQANKDVQKLHQQYGDFVRVGPREISINRDTAVRMIYEPPTQCIKSIWYAQVSDDVTKLSLNATRDLSIHKNRKRTWMRGLAFRALDVYQDRIISKVDLLLSRIEEHGGKPIDMTLYANFFGFDAMGQVGFSKDFGMLNSQKEHLAIQGLHESMAGVGVLGTVPWFMSMLSKLPGATGRFSPFTDWCSQQLKDKREIVNAEKELLKDQEPRDVVSWLLRAGEGNDLSPPPGEGAFQEDVRLIIIAGSDTTSVALTNALYYLTKNPAAYRKLQEQVRAEIPGGEPDWSHQKIKAIPYLDYVIYETLRLKPSVPSGLVRLSPPNGLQIDDVFIPGDTIVSVPCYTIHRDPRYWTDPLEFKPERWETLNTEKVPWIPFSRGQMNCPGRNLALMEIRMVLSRIALRYHLALPPGENGEKFDTDAKDTFTMSVPPLPLIFTSIT